MRLDTFLLSDAAETVGGKVSVLGGGITRINVQAVPFVLPTLTLVARFRADNVSDLGAEHTAALRLIDPEGTAIIALDPVPFGGKGRSPDAPDGEELYGTLVMSFGPVPLAKSGVYRVTLHLDGEVVRDMTLPVLEGPAPR